MMKNDIEWFVPLELYSGSAQILSPVWRRMLKSCGYYEKDLARALNIAPSTFHDRYRNTSQPLDVIARRKLIELLGEENFNESLGRVQLRKKGKYLLAWEMRKIMKDCRITLSTLADRSGVVQSTITKNYTEVSKNDVPLRIIDNLADIIGKEDFALAVLNLRGPMQNWVEQPCALSVLDPKPALKQPVAKRKVIIPIRTRTKTKK